MDLLNSGAKIEDFLEIALKGSRAPLKHCEHPPSYNDGYIPISDKPPFFKGAEKFNKVK